MLKRVCIFMLLLPALTTSGVAQMVGTGTYAFGSFDNKGFDSINLGNLNTHFTIPVFSKTGRGTSFNYVIAYDSLVWSPATASGLNIWTLTPTVGFTGLSGGAVTGYLTYYNGGPHLCAFGGASGYSHKNYVFHDSLGRTHPFNYSYQSAYTCGGTTTNASVSGDGSTNDGSGFTYSAGRVIGSDGSVILTPDVPTNTSYNQIPGSSVDSNGNMITANPDGSFTDTTNTKALIITGTGTQASPLSLTYPVTLQSNNAVSAAVIVNYKTYTVQTNFQCASISEAGALSTALVDSIVYPDSPQDAYHFSYEATPAGTGVTAGAVTGRVASITLPTGGVISYSYTGGCSNSGINSDGTPAILTRTTSDGPGKTYTRAIASGAASSTTTVVDEAGNQTSMTFVSSTNGLWYEFERNVYAGSPGNGAIPLQDRVTAYNGQTSATQITGSPTQTAVYEVFNGTNSRVNGATQTRTSNAYTASGLLTGSTVTDTQTNTTLASTIYTYNTLGEVLTQQTNDGSGKVVSYSSNSYDESTPTATSGLPQHTTPGGVRGNVTSSYILYGSGSLQTTSTYDDAGQVLSTTTANGTTKFSHDTTDTFLTATTFPTPSSGASLGTSASYNVASGALMSSNGLNTNQTTTLSTYDPLLRLTSLTTPEGGHSTTAYTPNNTSVKSQLSGSLSSDQETYLDGYGRIARVAVQSSSGWYLTDSCFDVRGLLQYQSTPYLNSTSNPSSHNCATSTATMFSYDALGRLTSTASPDNYIKTSAYNNRAVQQSDSNGLSKIVQQDLLGRVSAVCEISASQLNGSDSPQSCGLAISGTGFLTTYAYNLTGHSVTVNQNGQVRVFTTDSAGRITSVQEPESGTTSYTYSYNSSGLQIQRTRPMANQGNTGTTTTTTTQYDSLSRVISTKYSDGTPTKNFGYDFFTDGSKLGYSLGQMTYANTVGSSGLIEQQSRNYDVMGRVSQLAECLPQWCGGSQNYIEQYTYNLASLPNTTQFSTLLGNSSTAQLTYTYDTAGQTTYIGSTLGSGSNGNNYYNTNPATMTPFGPQLEETGNSLFTTYVYDSVGRSSSVYTCSNSSQTGCTGGSTVYSYTASVQGDQVKQSSDSQVGQVRQYQYDEFGRLKSLNTTSGSTPTLGLSFAYDRYGNRLQQNVTSGSGPQPQLTFSAANNHISSAGYSYDALGNVINDGLHSYTYDAENNLVSIDNGSTATYGYNALNMRDSVSLGGQILRFGFDLNGNRVTSWNNSGSLTQVQYYANGKAYAYWSNTDSNIHFEHQDWLGTDRVHTTANGSVEATYNSFPFGESASSTGPDVDPDHYAQLYADVSLTSGLHHAMFREYNASAGRWMSPDPYQGSYDLSNPQSLNRYSYAANNPLAYVDPSGLVVQCSTGESSSVSTDYNGTTITTTTPGESFCYDDGNASDWWDLEYGPGAGDYNPPTVSVPPLSPANSPNGAPSNPTQPKTCIQQALMSTIPGLQNASQTAGAPGPYNAYGHMNETDTLTFSSPAAQYAFQGSTRLGLVPGSVSELGYGPGVRLGNGLHVEFYGFPNGQFAVTSHLDLFNPNNGLGPLLGHFFVDVLFGHIKGQNSGALDKGCPTS